MDRRRRLGVLAAGRTADGHAVSGVRTSDDPVRDTWRGAELKAPGARDTLGRRATPQLAHGPNGEAGAGRAWRATSRRGAARRRPARTYFTVPLFGHGNLQKFE
jgi:hypothetical protein